ncbi:Sec-independent protein translocase subunit TatA [Kineosporia sp. A_224]|uniref:Sec-independent protein translocase subunit TatA n=1 Tax=Kineosporia sp. A_224 TaxID=1962180 RepID=UPI000B4A5A8A|nr:Sec-independent protein translocase subunit TatA [Kineosporia sp. A_224]
MGRILDHPAQLLIIVLLVVILFGAKRLPDAARGLGKSLRIFKTEVEEMKKDDVKKPETRTEAAPAAPLEGRVVDETRPQGTEQHRDA